MQLIVFAVVNKSYVDAHVADQRPPPPRRLLPPPADPPPAPPGGSWSRGLLALATPLNTQPQQTTQEPDFSRRLHRPLHVAAAHFAAANSESAHFPHRAYQAVRSHQNEKTSLSSPRPDRTNPRKNKNKHALVNRWKRGAGFYIRGVYTCYIFPSSGAAWRNAGPAQPIRAADTWRTVLQVCSGQSEPASQRRGRLSGFLHQRYPSAPGN